MECRSFVFGGAAVPSRACCAAYGTVYTSNESLCLCYVDDGTFWRAAGYDVDNATGDSFQIPERCGQVAGPPIEFWCEESGQLPPYGPQDTLAQPPAAATTAAAAAAAPMAQPPAPSESGRELPPYYGSHGTPALSPTAAAVPTAQSPAPSGSSSVAAAPTFTSPPPPPPQTSKAKRDSSPELFMLLVAIAAAFSII